MMPRADLAAVTNSIYADMRLRLENPQRRGPFRNCGNQHRNNISTNAPIAPTNQRLRPEK